MSRYRVTAPLVIAHDQERRAHHHYAGAVIQWLSPEQRAHFLDMGLVEEIPDATPPGVVPPGDEDQADEQPVTTPVVENPEPDSGQSETLTRPPQIAKKEIWVDWAIAAYGLDRAEAEGMTLEQLKALG